MGVLTGITKSTKNIETDMIFQNTSISLFMNGYTIIAAQLVQAVINVINKD